MDSVKESWAKTTSLMDDQGMLPRHNCKRCGQPLNADGGHPAELYLGTYSGLCYKCLYAPKIVEKVFYDGARRISYAPMYAPDGRGRRDYIAYDDCEVCEGNGRLYVSRGFALGGSYYRYCEDCFERFYAESRRKRYSNRRKWIRRAADAAFEQALRRARVWTKAKRGEAPKDVVDPIRERLSRKYDRVLEIHRARSDVQSLF